MMGYVNIHPAKLALAYRYANLLREGYQESGLPGQKGNRNDHPDQGTGNLPRLLGQRPR
jgi:hypothetical protein